MSPSFVFKQRLQSCSVSNLRIFLVFQLRTFKVGFSDPKTFRDFRETVPRTVSKLVMFRFQGLTRSSLQLPWTGRLSRCVEGLRDQLVRKPPYETGTAEQSS